MVDRRVLVGGLAAAVVVGGAGTFLGLRAAVPPRPSLPYPSGQVLQHVRGNCSSGNEVIGCDSGKGPRSFLEVRARGDVRTASDALFAAMTAAGWKDDEAGLVGTDYSEGTQSEDIQPVFCKDGKGCVGLFRYELTGYVLAWWDGPPGTGVSQPPTG